VIKESCSSFSYLSLVLVIVDGKRHIGARHYLDRMLPKKGVAAADCDGFAHENGAL
jgi:hypothetical protein